MSQPEPPGEPAGKEPPGTLDQQGQQDMIQRIGRGIVHSLPPGWREASVRYRAVGSYRELDAELIAPNGTGIPVTVTPEVGELFAELRHGMYQPQRGTWVSATYRLSRPASYSVDFNGDHNPDWEQEPPYTEFAAELNLYPRATHNIPAWLAERGGVTTPTSARSPEQLRKAEVFDGTDAVGRPVTNRGELPPEERDLVLEYLERAPVILAARGYDSDRLDPYGRATVPMTFHTDGSWIWPGAVGYYLRTHELAPQADLVRHIRERDFQLPYVDDEARELAVSVITAEQNA
ncbi:hypothetical protein SAMN04487905_11313 [Actinopolyspora xinjiangensis]|uniref:Uncharacterized protein n=1 Tax=Actinopolyspora xinjiangensis TaxID=405564 RepID=A0A1H0WLP2_9ACTN|nr:hypothetical protein [Actinopolyspora xinjiangensis]SDP91610.1 hypothetical protein SAMN04487905_11313 [Actinopolyspora xinjiangensis]